MKLENTKNNTERGKQSENDGKMKREEQGTFAVNMAVLFHIGPPSEK